jgi:hypothetical protein
MRACNSGGTLQFLRPETTDLPMAAAWRDPRAAKIPRKWRNAMKRKRGRPKRASASVRALAALVAAGIDPAEVDPRVILRSIAADVSAPATARVAACRSLLMLPAEGSANDDANDELNRRALAMGNSDDR